MSLVWSKGSCSEICLKPLRCYPVEHLCYPNCSEHNVPKTQHQQLSYAKQACMFLKMILPENLYLQNNQHAGKASLWTTLLATLVLVGGSSFVAVRCRKYQSHWFALGAGVWPLGLEY